MYDSVRKKKVPNSTGAMKPFAVYNKDILWFWQNQATEYDREEATVLWPAADFHDKYSR